MFAAGPASGGLGGSFPVSDADKIAAIQFGIEQGVDVNAVDGNGQTALHIAAGQSSARIVSALVERGAKVDIKNKQGRTPLDLARGIGGRGQPVVRTEVVERCNTADWRRSHNAVTDLGFNAVRKFPQRCRPKPGARETAPGPPAQPALGWGTAETTPRVVCRRRSSRPPRVRRNWPSAVSRLSREGAALATFAAADGQAGPVRISAGIGSGLNRRMGHCVCGRRSSEAW
jgi:hypothetical protein